MLHRLSGIVLAIVLLSALAFQGPARAGAAESSASIVIASVAATPGEVVDISVTATGFASIATLQLWITFNSEVLEYVNVVNFHPNLSGILHNLSEGVIKISWFNIAGTSIPDGSKLFDLRFVFCKDLLACVANQNASAIAFVEDRSFMTDPDYNGIPLSFVNGTVYSPDGQRSLTVRREGSGTVTVDGAPYAGPVIVPDGTALLLDAAADPGWFFAGWSGALGGDATPQTLLMDGNKEVTATFHAYFYSIIAMAGAGGSIVPSGEVQVARGDSQAFSIAAAAGYQIKEVTVDGVGVGAVDRYLFGDVTSNHSIFAQFAKDQYAIAAAAVPAGAGTVTGAGTYDHGTQATLTATAAAGYAFLHWKEGADTVSLAPQYTFTVTGARSLEAHFQPLSYTLTLLASPAGAGEVARFPDQESYHAGDVVTVAATPTGNYKFLNWRRQATIVSGAPMFSHTMPAANDTLTAHFAIDQHTVTALPNDDDFGTVGGAGQYGHGDEATLTATPADGYRFLHWMESDTIVATEARYTFTVTADRHLAAWFVPADQHTVTVVPNNPAFGMVGGAGQYGHGDEATLTATPETGYRFLHWKEGDEVVSTEAQYTFIVTADRHLVAWFGLKTYTIAAAANNAAFGTVTGAGQYEHGATVTLTATPGNSYAFLYWTEGQIVVATNAQYSFTATSDRTLVAHFGQGSFTVTFNVADQDGNPIGDAAVTFNGVTNLPGNYLFANIEPGSYPYSVSRAGYAAAEGMVDVQDNVSVDVVLSVISFTVQFSVAGSGGTLTAKAGGEDISTGAAVPYGSDVLFTATAGEGYKVTRWTLNGQTVEGLQENNYTYHSLDKDIDVQVLFTEITAEQFTLTVTIAGEGAVTVNGVAYTAPVTVRDGTMLVLAAQAAAGWRFDGWGGDLGGHDTIPREIVMIRDKQVTATFIREYEVTFRVDLTRANTYGLLSGFITAAHHIFIAGDMTGWAAPGTLPAQQQMARVSDEPVVYEKTFLLPAGTYEYKYYTNLLGAGFGGDEWPDGPNRTVAVTQDTIVHDQFGPAGLGASGTQASPVTIYPIPASEKIFITSGEAISHIRIVNSQGQLVYAATVEGLHHEIIVEHWNTGIYYLQATTPAGISTHRLQLLRRW